LLTPEALFWDVFRIKNLDVHVIKFNPFFFLGVIFIFVMNVGIIVALLRSTAVDYNTFEFVRVVFLRMFPF